MGSKLRLDRLLAERGLYESRSRAAASVLAGEVRLGSSGVPAQKPGQLVEPDIAVELAERPAYVSRGGLKLEHALAELELDPAGADCLDVGASTGGFTDCLLRHGAARVIGLDVGYGQLHWSLQTDDRVTVLDRRNARSLTAADLPFAPDLVTADVSFIALAKVLPSVLAAVDPAARCLALVKPQFEAGRDSVERGGVVRDPDARRAALVSVARCARGLSWKVAGACGSGLEGPAGNKESFLLLGGPESALTDVGDLEAAALAADSQ